MPTPIEINFPTQHYGTCILKIADSFNIRLLKFFLHDNDLFLYGDATNTGYNKDLYRDYPYHFWEFDKVRLSVVMQERFLEFNTIMIKHKSNDGNN